MLAYLASSAFGHLYRKIDCTAADIGGLRKAVYSRTVSIPLGLHNLEEIVLARQASPQATAARLRLFARIRRGGEEGGGVARPFLARDGVGGTADERLGADNRRRPDSAAVPSAGAQWVLFP